jgi:hypothetical protein
LVATSLGTRSQRRSDIKLIAVAAFMVLAAGGLIAAGLLAAMHKGGSSPSCGVLPLGSVDSIRRDLEPGAPLFRTGGGDCGFWLSLDGGDIVAYKLSVPGRDCTVTFHNDRFVCGGVPLDSADLAQYPTRIETKDGFDELIVDLRTPEQRRNATSTTAG